ncbi:MAG: hypothetical protein ACREPR_15355, partial [Brasilonema sp.]
LKSACMMGHIGQWQGDQARYIGLCKNLFDLRRMAVVHNLHFLLLCRKPLPEKLPTLSPHNLINLSILSTGLAL